MVPASMKRVDNENRIECLLVPRASKTVCRFLVQIREGKKQGSQHGKRDFEKDEIEGS